MGKKLLLISNSTLHGSGYLDHCESEIEDFLGSGVQRIVFVPYARPGGITHDEYTSLARERFKKMGYDLDSVHESTNPTIPVKEAEAIFIGGGNTFVLLNELYESGLIESIYCRVKDGVPYIGTSAGSNVTCPTIETTNDMPIMEVPTFNALNLIPFQINPHYLDPDPSSKHKGETRETRINEYLVFNDVPVVGLREGAILRLENDELLLKGSTGARVFQKGKDPKEYEPGSFLNFLLE